MADVPRLSDVPGNVLGVLRVAQREPVFVCASREPLSFGSLAERRDQFPAHGGARQVRSCPQLMFAVTGRRSLVAPAPRRAALPSTRTSGLVRCTSGRSNGLGGRVSRAGRPRGGRQRARGVRLEPLSGEARDGPAIFERDEVGGDIALGERVLLVDDFQVPPRRPGRQGRGAAGSARRDLPASSPTYSLAGFGGRHIARIQSVSSRAPSPLRCSPLLCRHRRHHRRGLERSPLGRHRGCRGQLRDHRAAERRSAGRALADALGSTCGPAAGGAVTALANEAAEQNRTHAVFVAEGTGFQPDERLRPGARHPVIARPSWHWPAYCLGWSGC